MLPAGKTDLFVFPAANNHSLLVLKHFNGITLSLYDIALRRRCRRVEKNTVEGTFRNVSAGTSTGIF